MKSTRLATAMAIMMILLVQQAAARFAIWDTGDDYGGSELIHTRADTAQAAINIFMQAFPGMTWAQMQALGYEVRETITP